MSERLGISNHTVKKHFNNIFGKIEATNKLELIKFLIKEGFEI
ncbi:LuxR C-terminal-related transcriptional regulator [Peribacillus sp. NPDC006672]